MHPKPDTYTFIGDEPVRCEKCGKVLVIRG